MARLQCGCTWHNETQCTREATQEDLLCDQCRDGQDRNTVMVYIHRDTGLPTGGHHHISMDLPQISLNGQPLTGII